MHIKLFFITSAWHSSDEPQKYIFLIVLNSSRHRDQLWLFTLSAYRDRNFTVWAKTINFHVRFAGEFWAHKLVPISYWLFIVNVFLMFLAIPNKINRKKRVSRIRALSMLIHSVKNQNWKLLMFFIFFFHPAPPRETRQLCLFKQLAAKKFLR